MEPHIRTFSNANWSHESAIVVQSAILSTLKERGECSVVLTGGKTAARLYRAWAQVFDHHKMKNINFYFSDERCVPHSDKLSNYNLVMSALFFAGLPSWCSIYPIHIYDQVSEGSALLYEKELPKKVDILILTVGEDGHIASLFPGSSALKEFHRSVIHVQSPHAPINRITITPKIVTSANKIFLLATGGLKGSVLSRALHSSCDANLFPVMLARHGVWLLDQDAAHNL